MKVRPHRGSLEDSMQCVEELSGTLEDLVEFLNTGDVYMNGHITPAMVKVEPYMFDNRIGWDTYIITVKGRCVGFADGPLTP